MELASCGFCLPKIDASACLVGNDPYAVHIGDCNASGDCTTNREGDRAAPNYLPKDFRVTSHERGWLKARARQG